MTLMACHWAGKSYFRKSAKAVTREEYTVACTLEPAASLFDIYIFKAYSQYTLVLAITMLTLLSCIIEYRKYFYTTIHTNHTPGRASELGHSSKGHPKQIHLN